MQQNDSLADGYCRLQPVVRLGPCTVAALFPAPRAGALVRPYQQQLV